jgi:hypothetical protein
MKKLPDYAKSLILLGLSTIGNCTDGLCYVEEQIKVRDWQELKDFCQWVDANIGGCSRYNIDMLFSAFKNPENDDLQRQANELANRIKSLKIS